MSVTVRLFTNIFVALALVADVFAIWVLIAGLAWVARFRRPLDATAAAIAGWARALAVAVAATATAGSLFYSEVAGFVPCQLCWYQRAVMYPLVVVLAVGFWPPARRITRWLGMAMALGGAGIAFYHWLVERIPSLAASTSCSVTVPCSVPWFTRLGFVTIAWMAFSGFVGILALLVCEARAASANSAGSARLSAVDSSSEENL